MLGLNPFALSLLAGIRRMRRVEEPDRPVALHGGPIEPGVRVRDDRVSDQVEQRKIGNGVGVEPALGEIDSVFLDELLQPVDLAFLETDRLD